MQRTLRLERRFVFVGDLVSKTALHIGGGDTTLGATDSPIIRRVDGQPFIPGSSLKGAFRSTVEKLAATLQLPYTHHDVLNPSWIKEFNERREGKGWTEEQTVEVIAAEWPTTAHLFGTSYTTSKLLFSDAYLQADQETVIQRRDGVAIDRDSERAVDRLKYDYEVAPPTLRWGFELLLENPSSTELGLTCLGVAELLGGFFSIGGKRSSGLGRVQLEGLQVYVLDLTTGGAARIHALQKYLIGKTLKDKFGTPQGVEFVNDHIAQFLEQQTNA